MAERVYAQYSPGDFPETEPGTRTLAGHKFHHTDMGNADRFEHLFGDRYFYVHDWRAFVVWTGKRWEVDRRGLMGQLAEKNRTVARALPEYGLRKFVQRALGHSLTGDNSEHALFIAHGGGSNSKSTILEAAMDCMGDYATISAEDVLVDKAGGHPTDVADLAGSRLVVASEVKEGAKLDEPKIKRMTGDRTLKARRMREDFWEFPKTFKIFMPVNHKPTIEGTDHGIWRRIKLIPFSVTIPKPEQDPRLPEKLRDELPGILAWLVRGCIRWQKDGLGETAEVTQATSAYKEEMDTLAAFLSDRCVIEDGASEGATDLFDAYKEWCADANETAGTHSG